MVEALPRAVLFDLLPAAFGPWGMSSWYPSTPPTPASLDRIERELLVRVPPLFAEVALACPAYGGWFGSIGEDYDSHNHLLTINADFHSDGMPSRYVMLNHGHDGHCDAWDLGSHAAGASEPPIVYFNYDSDRRHLRALMPSALSFAEYIDRLVRTYAPRCGTKGLRRRAKRILAGLDKGTAGH